MDPTNEAKKVLAWLLVANLHGREAADEALTAWERHDEPEPDVVSVASGNWPLPRLLVEVGLAVSTSEARRVIAQGGARVDGRTITDVHATVDVESEMVIRVGKRKGVRLEIRKEVHLGNP